MRRSLAYGLLCVVVVAVALLAAGCTPHTGGSEVAFLRGDELWVALSDGSDARMLADGGIVSFAWSPDHHSLVFRAVKGAPAKGTADAVGTIYAVSINGGYPLQISPDDAGVALGDAVWDANGNRVLYREFNLGSPDAPIYVVSQTDQPVGVARKLIANAATLPALRDDGQRYAEIDAAGAVWVGTPGGGISQVADGALSALPVTGRPGRVWWQPKHDAVLYAAVANSGVELRLHATSGSSSSVIASVDALLDAAFSPDGSFLLVRTPSEFEMWRMKGDAKPLFTWPESDAYALPWWSPDGKTLVIEHAGGIERVNVATHAVDALLAESQGEATAEAPQSWRVATSSPFSPDGGSIVFAAESGATWQGKALAGSGGGVYTVSLGATSSGKPGRIQDAKGIAPGWGFSDAATEFLAGAS